MKNGLERWVPPLIVVLGAIFLTVTMLPRQDQTDELRLSQVGRIPVVDNGRVKPLDTVARTSLLIFSHKQSYTDELGHSQPAIRWLLDILSSNWQHHRDPAMKPQVVRIENDQLLGLLGLKERPGLRYSIDEFRDKIKELQDQEQSARARKAANKQDAYDEQVIDLADNLRLYVSLSLLEKPHLVPPQGSEEDWRTLPEAEEGVAPADQTADVRAWNSMLRDYAEGKTGSFNSTVSGYLASLNSRFPKEVFKADLETYFNAAAPFFYCMVLYVVVFLLAVLGYLGLSRVMWRSAFWLLALVFLVHTAALGTRMYLSWRPPTTNLYSSAVFIGWVAVFLGLVLEGLFKNGIGSILGAVMGFVTLIIAHNLMFDGDTMEMMRAVLDTNFWLATHVTAVTIGYTATFAAGVLGIVYILLGVFTPLLNRVSDRSVTVMIHGLPIMAARQGEKIGKTLSSMIYGVVCFALMMSFIGTVLGGIWADQSWGRFWGWDPKENGALLIVIWNSLMLHARWGGMVRQRGFAVLTVFGNVVTSWSWFGVNMLGVGLHSYGFMKSAAFWLGAFMLSQLVLIGIGLLPPRMWRSFVAQAGGQSSTPQRGDGKSPPVAELVRR